MNNNEIARAFNNNKEVELKNKNMFVENINGVFIIFSYGYHFPISIKFQDGFLFNKDGYSNTTARHKNVVLNEIGNLNDEDFKTTRELIRIIDKIKYHNLKTKNELIEQKI